MTMNKRLLRVNLSNGAITHEQIPTAWVELCLGGKTLGLYLALKEGLAVAESLSPANKVFLLSGPLTGYVAGGATVLVTKSPLTQTLTDPIAQSNLGFSLKASGFDGLVIEGTARDPVYLAVNEDQQRILPAANLWGMPCSAVYTALRKFHPEITHASTVAIGPAGENRVRYAAVMADTRAFGRGGAGAVFGSKNLKGIIIGGNSLTKPADADLLQRQDSNLRAYAYSDKHPYLSYQSDGTATIYKKHLHTGCMSGWNYQSLNYEDPSVLDLANGVARLFTKDPSVCFKCYIACARSGPIQTGKLAGQTSNGPEFETIWAFGPQCANTVVDVVVEADLLCDELGLDSLSTGNVIGFYLECVERGLLPESSVRKDIPELINQIAHRSGVGDLLAEGVKRAAEALGFAAECIAMHVKGLEMPAYDPRGFNGISLAYAVSSRGGCHRKAFCPEEAKGKVDGATLEGKAQMVITEEHKSAYRDSMVVCKWSSAGRDIPYYLDALRGTVGVEYSYDELLRLGAKAVNLARVFNVAQGYTRDHDTLPARFFDQPKESGPLAGKRVDRRQLELLKDEYYRLRGWTECGVPTRAVLESLDLDRFLL